MSLPGRFLAPGLVLTMAVCGGGVAQEPPAPAAHYVMPVDAEVTLGVYDFQGRLLRWLTRSDFRRAGPQPEPWDGLDQWGQAA